MIIFLIAVLLVIVLVFGISSMMQSYASAQQAQATIETAKALQVATFGNVLVIVLVTLIVLAIIALAIYLVTRKTSTEQKYIIGVDRASAKDTTKAITLKYIENNGSSFTVEQLTPEQFDQLSDEIMQLIED